MASRFTARSWFEMVDCNLSMCMWSTLCRTLWRIAQQVLTSAAASGLAMVGKVTKCVPHVNIVTACIDMYNPYHRG